MFNGLEVFGSSGPMFQGSSLHQGSSPYQGSSTEKKIARLNQIIKAGLEKYNADITAIAERLSSLEEALNHSRKENERLQRENQVLLELTSSACPYTDPLKPSVKLAKDNFLENRSAGSSFLEEDSSEDDFFETYAVLGGYFKESFPEDHVPGSLVQTPDFWHSGYAGGGLSRDRFSEDSFAGVHSSRSSAAGGGSVKDALPLIPHSDRFDTGYYAVIEESIRMEKTRAATAKDEAFAHALAAEEESKHNAEETDAALARAIAENEVELLRTRSL